MKNSSNYFSRIFVLGVFLGKKIPENAGRYTKKIQKRIICVSFLAMFNSFLDNEHPQITMIDQRQSEFLLLGFNHLLKFMKAKVMTKKDSDIVMLRKIY